MKEVLTQSIKACFDAHPNLCDLPHFSGLFTHATRQQPREGENQRPIALTSHNTLPQSQELLLKNLLNILPT